MNHKPVLAREREARLIFESCGMVLCPVPNSFLPQVCEDMWWYLNDVTLDIICPVPNSFLPQICDNMWQYVIIYGNIL